MIHITSALKRPLAGAALALALISPGIANAQSVPSYADGGQNQQIQGTVAAIDGTWNISVNDANGYTDNVALHQGTIINPTGLTLEPGMSVTIDGYADGPTFDAMEIDTPYQYSGPAPVAVYYGAGVVYPGFAVGWGPSFSLSFDFANRSFVRRPFFYGGNEQRAIQPPAGWQNAQRGYVPNQGRQLGYSAPRTDVRTTEPALRSQYQQRDAYAAPQQSRSFAAPQQTRSFAAPQQNRSFAAPQRSFSAPVARASAPAPRGNQGGGDHRRG
jgi:hypothetical protein